MDLLNSFFLIFFMYFLHVEIISIHVNQNSNVASLTLYGSRWTSCERLVVV